MAISVVGGAGFAKTVTDDASQSNTAPNITLPASLLTGDYGLLLLSANSGSITISSGFSGWTVHASSPVSGASTLEIWLLTKNLTAADSSTSVSGVLSATARWGMAGIVLRGTAQAIDFYTSSNGGTATSTSLTHAAVTPVANDCLRVTMIGARRAANDTVTSTPPNVSWTEQVDGWSAHTVSPRNGAFIDTIQLVGQAGVSQGAVNGTATLAVVQAAFHLTVAPAAATSVTGTLATTLDDATLAASGTETITGTLATTLADTTLAASGTSSNPVSGTLAATLADTTLAASGTETLTGTLASTLADTTLAGSGTETFAGSLSATLANTVLAGSGTETLTGSLASTLADATLAASGTVSEAAPPVTGALAVTLDDATLSAAGTVGTVSWFATPTVRRAAGEKRPYSLYTLNKGVSVVLIDGHYRRYPIPPHTMLLPLVAGRDYFIGGTAAVVVSDAVAAALTADGFTVYDHNPDED